MSLEALKNTVVQLEESQTALQLKLEEKESLLQTYEAERILRLEQAEQLEQQLTANVKVETIVISTQTEDETSVEQEQKLKS